MSHSERLYIYVIVTVDVSSDPISMYMRFDLHKVLHNSEFAMGLREKSGELIDYIRSTHQGRVQAMCKRQCLARFTWLPDAISIHISYTRLVFACPSCTWDVISSSSPVL
jgi:hypothetical protein